MNANIFPWLLLIISVGCFIILLSFLNVGHGTVFLVKLGMHMFESYSTQYMKWGYISLVPFPQFEMTPLGQKTSSSGPILIRDIVQGSLNPLSSHDAVPVQFGLL